MCLNALQYKTQVWLQENSSYLPGTYKNYTGIFSEERQRVPIQNLLLRIYGIWKLVSVEPSILYH